MASNSLDAGHSTNADVNQISPLPMTGTHLEAEEEIAKSVPDPPAVELQDQTNFLPLKQLLIVFAGLSMAMGCSMLDQSS